MDIGCYRFSINILNLPGKVDLEKESLGEGGYGTVVTKQVVGTEFAAKVIRLKNSEEKKEDGKDKQKPEEKQNQKQ